MKDFDRETQNWYLYKNLELLPKSEHRLASIPTFGLDRLWRGLLGLLADELVDEKCVEYLERCFQRDISESSKKQRLRGLRRFLKLME